MVPGLGWGRQKLGARGTKNRKHMSVKSRAHEIRTDRALLLLPDICLYRMLIVPCIVPPPPEYPADRSRPANTAGPCVLDGARAKTL